jgi:hypothetical protein
MSVDNGGGFDQWLEQQLHNEAARASGPSPAPAQSQYHAAYLQGGLHMSVLGHAASVVSIKGAIGLTVAILAVGAAGAAGEAAVTGSANPSIWGQAVVQQVKLCKADLASGSHGIGQCVSAFAKQHGPKVSADHRASGARTQTPGNPGKPSNAPGKPSNAPGGKPSTVPPTSHP